MEVFYLKEFNDLSKVSKNINLVLGLFDGLHIGHAQLIRSAKYLSEGKLAVITFDLALKNNDNTVIMPVEEKINSFASLEVDEVYVFHCDDNFKKMSYEDFIERILKKFQPKKIFCGQDFKFGYKAQGDVNILKANFANVVVLNYVNTFTGEKISSSVIKKYIQNGNIEEANHYLGREYEITGTVIKGKHNGKKLGFPTINLKLNDNYVLPEKGVYITKTIVDKVCYYSMSNVGTHPTLEEISSPIVESYILDFNNNIYGKKVITKFIKKIRDEMKFNNVNELVSTLKANELEVRKYFNIY